MGSDNTSIMPFILFFVGIAFLAIVTRGPDGEIVPLIDWNATTTESGVAVGNQNTEAFISGGDGERVTDPVESEEDFTQAHTDLDLLEGSERESAIWGERSNFENDVTLTRGNTTTGNPHSEYLVLKAREANRNAIDISRWSIESHITGRGAFITEGAKTYEQGKVNDTTPILLAPGERAYIVTGISPVGVSFHENSCTGYLSQFQEFTPPLTQNCPSPSDELARFGSADAKKAACANFVNRINTCSVPDNDVVDDSGLTGACKSFIHENLSYNGCREKHVSDSFFVEGRWYVYLEAEQDLWRAEREILRVLDKDGYTVDVVEY